MQLARLFEFAQRLFIRQLKNYVIWQLFNLRSKNHIPPIPVVKFVFENLPDDSPFREVLVAWYTWHRDSACALTPDSLDALPQFTSALVIAMVKQRYASAKDPFLGSPDVYYESTMNEFYTLLLRSHKNCVGRLEEFSIRTRVDGWAKQAHSCPSQPREPV
jgi:hypothetical protein